MKKSTASLIIREMKIRIIVRYHLTLVRMAIIKKTTSVGKDMEKRKPLCIVGGNVNCSHHYGKHYGVFSKN